MDSHLASKSARFTGRLFSQEGRLHLVLDVDAESDSARISCRVDGDHQVFQMPISEVSRLLSANADMRLDGLQSTQAGNRVVGSSDGWYFETREGTNGPFQSKAAAREALGQHVIAAQGESA
jgi:hypothetical protein